ncbi:cylicin-1-like [Haliotis asinina]|uniref:cylicin-1-like n=1 Tax=Haliotis asinina TaxID=109174 RepID=UPI003531AB8F
MQVYGNFTNNASPMTNYYEEDEILESRMKAIGLGIFLISLVVSSSAVPLTLIKDPAIPQLCMSSADCEAVNQVCLRPPSQNYGHSVPASGLETDVDLVWSYGKTCQSSADCDAVNQSCVIPIDHVYGRCIAKKQGSHNATTPRIVQDVAEQLEKTGKEIDGMSQTGQNKTKQLRKRLQRNSDRIGNIRSQLQPRVPSTRDTTKQYRKRSLNLDLDLDTALDKTLSDLEVSRISNSVKVRAPMLGKTKAKASLKNASGKKDDAGVNVKGDVEIHVTHHVIHTTADNRTIGNSSNTSKTVKTNQFHGLETNWRRIINGKHDLLNASLPRQQLGLHQMGVLLASVAKAIKHDINRDPFKHGSDKYYSEDFSDIQKKEHRGHDHAFKYDDTKDLRHRPDDDDEDRHENEEEEKNESEDEDKNDSRKEEKEKDEEGRDTRKDDYEYEDEEGNEDEDQDTDEEQTTDEDEEDESEDVKRKRTRSYANKPRTLNKNMKGSRKQKRSFGIVQEAVEAIFSDNHRESEKSSKDSDEKSDRDRRNVASLEELSPVSVYEAAIEQDAHPQPSSTIPQLHSDVFSPTHVPSHQEDSQQSAASNKWSECSVTCGLGTRKRMKVCAGTSCTPGQIQIKPCMMPIC